MNGRNHHQCSRKFKWADGKTILEAPARTGTAFGFEGNDEETASSFGRSSHADTDRKTLDLADQTIGPSCGRWRVPGERQSDACDGTIMIHRLHDERYQRWRNAPTSVGRKEPSSCPTKSGTRISDSSSMFWESRIRAFFASPFVSTGRTTTDSPKSPVPDGPWRTSAPYASSLSGAADNRWGGRDKRKDIHRKKERSWERNQPHTHAVRTAWTSTTRPT